MSFHPVLVLPPGYDVLELSRPEAERPPRTSLWSVGRWDEDRVIYTQPLFGGGRSVHVGIDLGGPAGAAVHAFAAGEVILAGTNPADGDYGPTLVCAHVVDDAPLYVLLGHLSRTSLERSPVGRTFAAGEVLGWLGDVHENGGWPPHVHVQLCRRRPEVPDMPGAVTTAERARALEVYPDPRRILGPLYRS